MDGDLVLLHQEGDALAELLCDPAAALHHRVDIGADLLRDQTIITGMLHIMIDFGRAQQRLGRNAAPVEADAAEILALDDRCFQTQLGRADRRDIAAGA
jgi:hypothetical protein